MVEALLGLGAVVLLFWCAQDVWREYSEPRLAADPRLSEGPLVSVLIPARNEAERIGACLAGLARQRYPHFEVIVVDDHSTDATAEVVRSFAGQLAALRIIEGAPLPNDWLGKPWACWQAAQQANGEWLLFLDADVIPQPDLLGAVVAYAQSQRAEFLTVMPLQHLHSFAERLVLPTFLSILYALYPLAPVSDPRSSIAFANGQCLLIERRCYKRLRGHTAVRNSVLEDTDFGQIAKASGARIAAVNGAEQIAVRMYTDWPNLAEGLIKNAVAGFRSGGWRSAFVGLRQALIAWLPWGLLAVWLQGGALLWLGCALLAWGSTAWLVWRRYRLNPAWGLLYPLGLSVYFGLTAIAVVRLSLGQGVRWKGRRIG